MPSISQKSVSFYKIKTKTGAEICIIAAFFSFSTKTTLILCFDAFKLKSSAIKKNQHLNESKAKGK